MDETLDPTVESVTEEKVEAVVEALAPAVEEVPADDESKEKASVKRMPRKGRELDLLADKEKLQDALVKTPTVRALVTQLNISYSVLMNWLAFHGLELPDRDDMVVSKFYDSVVEDPTTGCWNWQGKATIRYQGKSMRPDRFAVVVIGGLADLGRKRIVAACGNPNCVNPAHLVLKAELPEEEEAPAVAAPEPAPAQ